MVWRGIQGAAVRWLAPAIALAVLNGCPPECEQPDGEITLVPAEQDPTLGAFEGSLAWLQTSEESAIRITVSRHVDSASRTCDRAQIGLGYEVETSDQSLSASLSTSVDVDDDGVVVPTTQALTLDVGALVSGGKVPDAPGILERKPTASLVLVPTPEGLSASILVRSSGDNLTIALGTLSPAP